MPLPDVEGVSHRYVDADGVTLHVAEAGQGMPVLLLHGWPQNWYSWRRVIPLLAPSHRLICADLRGFGWSEAPPGLYRKATLAQDVIALLDALELQSVELLAHDWGAWIGFMLCLREPQRFKHYLALNIPTPWPERPSPKAAGALARLWYQAAIATPLLGSALVRRTQWVPWLIRRGAVHDAWSEAELETYAAVLRAPERAGASVHLYRTFLTRELLPYLAGEFDSSRLTVPTLLLHGTRDFAIDHRRLGLWREHAEDMTVELREDSGHFIAEELPNVVAQRALTLFD